ncbi:carbohydrate kinase family protein [Salininema proteolyticum]|uniref:Carbohydrate kinase n=1 Tax=Salininema proteolyticum TaxID=1607685 RepID=A0ABV8TUY7_9ACTN
MAADRILVAGEALIDIVVRPDGTTASHPGGSPANVALTLGRLGHRPTLLTSIGADAHGTAIRRWLDESHVRLANVPPATGRTSTARAELDANGSASYDFDLHWDLSLEQAGTALEGGDAPAFVHIGSIATVLEPGADAIADLYRRSRPTALLSFDPNARPAITTDRDRVLPRVEELVGLSDIVKVSDEDLSWYYPERDALASARQWAERCPGVLVLTRGSAGSTAFLNGEEIEVALARAEVADTIGAGDSYMGALIDAVGRVARDRSGLEAMTSDQWREAMEFAAEVAAVTVSRAGANPPWRKELAGDRKPEVDRG